MAAFLGAILAIIRRSESGRAGSPEIDNHASLFCVLPRGADQAFGSGAGLGGDFRAGEHARDLLAAAFALQFCDLCGNPFAAGKCVLSNEVMTLGPRRYLRDFRLIPIVLFATISLFALKTIVPEVPVSPKDIQRFLREANILRRLDHSHIVAFRDMNEANGVMYFAMDYVRGTDAARLLRQQGSFTVERASQFMCTA